MLSWCRCHHDFRAGQSALLPQWRGVVSDCHSDVEQATRSVIFELLPIQKADPFAFSQWFPEISHHAPNIPIILVGTKLDLREDGETINKLRERRMQPIAYQQAAAMARDIGAVRCVEPGRDEEEAANLFR